MLFKSLRYFTVCGFITIALNRYCFEWSYIRSNRAFFDNMWVFFLLTPIPISSIIFGFVLKSKGYKYKKNIIGDFIITFILCIYGSFIFIS